MTRLDQLPDDRTEAALPDACALVVAVRDHDCTDVARILTDTTTDLYAVTVLLAAMVPPDRTPADLLRWTTLEDDDRWDDPATVRKAHSAYTRGLRDGFTVAGEQVYQRRSYEARKAHSRDDPRARRPATRKVG